MCELEHELGEEGGESLVSRCPRVILIRGLPGSGKSTIAQELVSLLGNASLLDPDHIDYSGFEYNDFVSGLQQRLPSLDSKYFPYRFLLHKARLALTKGEDIIWCQPFSDQEGLFNTIETLRNYASEMNSRLDITIIDVEVDPNTAFNRVSARRSNGGHGLDEESFRDFVDHFSYLRGYSLPRDCHYLFISGEGDLLENAQIIYGTILGRKEK